MWTQGSLADRKLDQVLLVLASRNATGTLTVQGEDVIAVRFRNGEVVGAAALDESLAHGLGRFLVAAGHLNRDQMAAMESADLEGSVIDHLLTTGLVPPATLAGCVRQYTYLLMVRLLGWSVGEYAFYEGEVTTVLAVRPLGVEEILVRASEEDPRLLGFPVPPLGGEVLRPVLRRRALHVMSWNEEPGATAEGDRWLTPFEDALLRSLDALTPSRDFKDALGVDEYRLRFALARLRIAGLVEAVDEAERAAPVPAAEMPEEALAGAVAAPGPGPQLLPSPRAAAWADLAGQIGDLGRAFSYVLAAGLASVVLLVLLLGNGAQRVLFPLPIEEQVRRRLDHTQVSALHGDLIGKLTTYHILYGTFPLDLRPLVDLGMVSPADLQDSHGRNVVFEALDRGFVLSGGTELGEQTAGPRTRFSVGGDFLLDPDYVGPAGEPGGNPVRLLD